MNSGFVIGDRLSRFAVDTHPMWQIGYGDLGSLLVVGASAIGKFHLAHGQARDDAFAVRSFGPWIAAAVADGLGSRPYSRFGASCAVDFLTSQLLASVSVSEDQMPQAEEDLDGWGHFVPPAQIRMPSLRLSAATSRSVHIRPPQKRPPRGFLAYPWRVQPARNLKRPSLVSSNMRQAGSLGWWPAGDQPVDIPKNGTQTDEGSVLSLNEMQLKETMFTAFTRTHTQLDRYAHSLGRTIEELGCTALGVLFNYRSQQLVVGQIGDGAILGLAHQGASELVTSEETGDPQSTYTLTHRNFDQHMGIQVLSASDVRTMRAIFLMTDGLSGDLLYSPQTDAFLDWAKRVNHNLLVSSDAAQAAEAMLNWLATYEVTGSWDDRTLIVITRKEEKNANG